MTAVIISGRQFSSQEEVTQDKCYSIVEAMGMTNLGGAETSSTATIVYVSATAPTVTKYIWFDSSLNLVRTYDGTNWQPQNGIVLTNKSGLPRVRGDLVTFNAASDSSFGVAAVADNLTILGVVAESIEADVAGVVILSGLAYVNLDAPYGDGQFYLATSGTAGRGKARSTVAAYTLGALLDSSSATGLLVPVHLWGQASI